MAVLYIRNKQTGKFEPIPAIKGNKGDPGYTPQKGIDYFDGEPFTYEDFTPEQLEALKGEPGNDGVGIKSVVQTTTSSDDGGSNVVTVTKTDGTTSTFIVKNGSKGSQGDPGKTPVKGTDYFTPADKEELVSALIDALPVYNGEVV